MIEGMRSEGYSLADVVALTQKRCEKRFVDGSQEAKLEDTDWVWEDELELLREEMRSVADQCRADETKKLLNSTEVRILSLFCDVGSTHQNASPRNSVSALSSGKYPTPWIYI